jgi:DNA-binding NarL/FixJ family response regulator
MTRVALIEDNPAMRRNLERMLQRAPGLTCVGICRTGEEALEHIPASKPEVVLMDINLPGISGIECTARLKQMMPAIQVIMLTVYEDSESIFSALKAGACGYLLKRSSPSDILDAIDNVRSGGAPMTSEIARKVVFAFHEPAPAHGETASLSAREQEILELLSQGKLSKEIADQLQISFHTVRVHLKHIYEKLHVRSRAEAAFKFIKDSGRLPPGAKPPPA